MYSTAQWVKNQMADVYQDALAQVLQVYNTGGFENYKDELQQRVLFFDGST